MNHKENLLIFTILIFLFSGCKYIKENGFIDSNNNQSKTKETLEVSISCEDKEIDDFLNEGWVIVKEYSEEKICSWKTVPLNNKCNLEKDKGCKITKPDKIGKEVFYLLER